MLIARWKKQSSKMELHLCKVTQQEDVVRMELRGLSCLSPFPLYKALMKMSVTSLACSSLYTLGHSPLGSPHVISLEPPVGSGVGEGKCLSRTSVSLPALNTESHYININLSSCCSHPTSRYYSRAPAHRQGACSLSLSPGPTAMHQAGQVGAWGRNESQPLSGPPASHAQWPSPH